jgi:protein TonB
VDLPFSLVQVKEQPPPPDYPPLARSAGLQGTVIVEVLVGADGIPMSVRALSGPYALRATAEAYARAMKFKPHLENGKPTAARFQLDMPFRLK